MFALVIFEGEETREGKRERERPRRNAVVAGMKEVDKGSERADVTYIFR